MKILSSILMIGMLAGLASANRNPVRFDANGQMILPDDYLIYQGLESAERGYNNDAMRQLKEASEFGNKDAQHMVGLLYLQNGNNIQGYSWLKLAGTKVGKAVHLISGLESQMSEEDLLVAEQNLLEIEQEFGSKAAIKRRYKWKNSQRFVGSRIGGYVSPMADITLEDGNQVYGHTLKDSLEGFVFDYRYDRGEVILKDFDVIESDE